METFLEQHADLKKAVEGIGSDVKEIKGDTGEIKVDVKAIKGDTGEMKDKLDSLDAKVDSLLPERKPSSSTNSEPGQITSNSHCAITGYNIGQDKLQALALYS